MKSTSSENSKFRASESKISRTYSSNESDLNKKPVLNVQKSMEIPPTQNNIFQQNLIIASQQSEKIHHDTNFDLISPKENQNNKRQSTSQVEVKKISPKNLLDDNVVISDSSLHARLQEAISPPNQNQQEQNELSINENTKTSSIIHFERENGNNDDLNYSMFLGPENKRQNDIIYSVIFC